MSAPALNSRASAWEWAQAALLAANLAWTTLCLGGFLAQTMVVTSALTGALVAVHFAARACEANAAPRLHAAGWLLVPFLVYALANVLWVTPVRWLGWRDWFGWAEMIAVFWVVLNGVRAPGPRRALLGTLAAVAVVAVGLGCYQRCVDRDWLMLGRTQADQFLDRASGSFGIPNSLAALLLLLLPAAGALAWQRAARPAWRVAAAWLAAVFAVGLVLTISRGAWLSLAAALVAWPLFAVRGRWLRRLALAGATLLAVLAAGAMLIAALPKVRERFVTMAHQMGELSRPILWRAGWKLFRAHPAVGSGAGSFNVLFEQHRPEGFALEPVWAHNDYLNTLSDYGAAGFGLFFGAGGAIAWRCTRRRKAEAPPPDDPLDAPAFTGALAVGLAAFALQLFVDFHFKIAALAMAFATLSALAVQRCWPAGAAAGGTSRASRLACGLVALGCAAGTAFFVVPLFRAEGLRERAHDAIDRVALHAATAAGYRAALPGARADLARAVAIDPANAQAWADLAYAISLEPHAAPARAADRAWLAALGREAEAAANRALALTRVRGEFFLRRGVARDLQGRWFEGGSDFTHALTLTPANALAWYYYAYHLSLNSAERDMTEMALAFCLRLDPGNSPGLALRQHLAKSRPAP
jgi:O-antigen ligase